MRACLLGGFAALAWLVVTTTLAGGSAGEQVGSARGLEAARVVVPASRTDAPLYSGSYALVIGISQYTAGWSTLPGVREDVDAVTAALQHHGFEVVIARDLGRDDLDRAIRSFITNHGSDPDHRLVIYFAGHGETLTMPDGREVGYLVAADAPLSATSEAQFAARAISMDEVDGYARRIRAKHALFVFDSCFSGALFTALRQAPQAITERVRQPVRQFITAGAADQAVPDRSEFRRQFVAALQGDADLDRDGFVTGVELGYWVEQQIINYSRGAQTPRSGKIRDPALDRGDIVFRSPRVAGPPPVRPDVEPTPVAPPPTLASTPALLIQVDTSASVVVNGAPTATVAAGEVLRVPVSPGRHIVQIRSRGAPAFEETRDVVVTATDHVIVRFAPLAFRPTSRATVIQQAAGLEWAARDNGTDIEWTNASPYCHNLGSGWRLPTVEELEALYEAVRDRPQETTRCGAAWRPVPGIRASCSKFWSSTTRGNDVYFVAFSDGSRRLSMLASWRDILRAANSGHAAAGSGAASGRFEPPVMRALCVRRADD